MENKSTWLCPICGVKSLEYGKTCERPDLCENTPHITGATYVDKSTGKRKKQRPGDSIGIAEIANKSDED